MPCEIAARLMVERPDLASATADALKLIEAIAAFGHPARLNVQAYWKIAAYFDIVVTLRGEDADTVFRRVANALAPEWEWPSESAVWDYKNHAGFKVQSLAPSARWAEISIVRKEDEAKL